MEQTKNTQQVTQFTLKQVAAWQLHSLRDTIADANYPIVGVPSLQRGAVWDAQQIEMLWDSIFRGFPIGSIVISEKIKSQNTKGAVLEERKSNEEVTHHILDGQQRTNAIAWGFDQVEFPISDEKLQCLWLDLMPGDLLNKQGNSRQYLFRVTTKAHKWGFKASEKLEALSLNQRREFNQPLKDIQPLKLKDMFGHFPIDARLPVPLGMLWSFFDGDKFNFDGLFNDDWFKKICDAKKITQEAIEKEIDRELIEAGFRNAFDAKLLALPVATQQIADIEQIFLRLNRQGTPLDNEELIYSMIKAYWPGVESVFSCIKTHHTTEARLINMALRVALHSDEGAVLPEKNIQQVRDIFSTEKDSQRERDERDSIQAYFNSDYKNSNLINSNLINSDLIKSLEWIDDNLVWSEDVGNEFKMPRFLRSSIAWHSRDVFVWLLFIAKQKKFELLGDESAKRVLAIALTIHWFAKDKADLVRWLVKQNPFADGFKLLNEDTAECFHGAGLLSPENVKNFLQLEDMTKEQLKQWQSLWQGTVVYNADGKNKYTEDEQLKRREDFEFVNRMLYQRELLVYVQAPYIEETFSDYDPSNKLMWKGHNRPWDYDHILPSNTLNATGRGHDSGEYHAACKVWQQTIGNLVAVDLVFNRSASDIGTPLEKYASDEPKLHACFEQVDLTCFNLELKDTENLERSQKFVGAVKNRALRVYQAWFENLDVQKIIKIF